MSYSTVHEPLKKIGKISKEGIWVHHEFLLVKQTTFYYLQQECKLSFLHNIVIGDEKWVLHVSRKSKKIVVITKWETSANIKTRTPSIEALQLYLAKYGIYKQLEHGRTIGDI